MEPAEAIAQITPPKTNPDTGKPAVPSGRQPQGMRPASDLPHHTTGADLVPDASEGVGVVRRYRYWVGVTPSCPVEGIDLGGVNFPKINENIVPDPMRSDVKRRVPVVGAIVWLTEQKLKLMLERLPRTVVRFTDDKGEHQEPGTGQNVGDNHRQPRRGHVITIPTNAEVDHRMKNGKPTRAYNPRGSDAPAARFMFAQLCDDQVNGSRGDYYPETLEVTGLGWPETIEQQTADLLS